MQRLIEPVFFLPSHVLAVLGLTYSIAPIDGGFQNVLRSNPAVRLMYAPASITGEPSLGRPSDDNFGSAVIVDACSVWPIDAANPLKQLLDSPVHAAVFTRAAGTALLVPVKILFRITFVVLFAVAIMYAPA